MACRICLVRHDSYCYFIIDSLLIIIHLHLFADMEKGQVMWVSCQAASRLQGKDGHLQGTGVLEARGSFLQGLSLCLFFRAPSLCPDFKALWPNHTEIVEEGK